MFDRLKAASTLPSISMQQEPSRFKVVESTTRPKGHSKCSRCGIIGHIRSSKACPRRHNKLLEASLRSGTTAPVTAPVTVTETVTQTTTRSITRSLSPSSPGSVLETIAVITTYTITRVLTPPAPAAPALRFDDPRDIF